MLGDRQELHMREAQFGHVCRQFGGEFTVRNSRPPRPEVHLVDAERCAYRALSDAVAGVVSAYAAIGSALSRHTPSGPQIENLYRVPARPRGTKSSHTPAPP